MIVQCIRTPWRASSAWALLLVIALNLATPKLYAAAEVVFDSLPNAGTGGTLSIELGQSLELAGTARTVTRIDLIMSSSNNIEPFRVNFYTIGSNNFPQTLLWTSPWQTWTDDSPFAARKLVSVAVPNIVVPNRFAWTTVRELPTQLLQTTSTATFASIGTNLTGIDRSTTGDWQTLNGLYTARIIAIPEPSSLLLALAGFSLLALRRR